MSQAIGLDKARIIMLASRGTGKYEDAAKALGCAKKSIGNWKVNAEGKVTSRRILDAVARALVRQHWEDRLKGRRPMRVPEEDIKALLGME